MTITATMPAIMAPTTTPTPDHNSVLSHHGVMTRKEARRLPARTDEVGVRGRG
jgi:hypothetical protein